MKAVELITWVIAAVFERGGCKVRMQPTLLSRLPTFSVGPKSLILLMDEILRDLKDPKLW